MADKKISALTAATTPLAGTEVLPIVQSNATVKVATNDLTVKNLRAASTTGILQVSGPTAGTTRTMTVPDANFTAARTDAVNSFTGDQTLSTGNLIIGTAGKGIDFSATANAAGMTSELLSDYEEGTWTATLTGSTAAPTTPVTSTGYYTKVGRLVNVVVSFVNVDTTGATGNMNITGLPFTVAAAGPTYTIGTAGSFSTGASAMLARIQAGQTVITFVQITDVTVAIAINAGTPRFVYVNISYVV